MMTEQGVGTNKHLKYSYRQLGAINTLLRKWGASMAQLVAQWATYL